jgi:hypothetical protein
LAVALAFRQPLFVFGVHLLHNPPSTLHPRHQDINAVGMLKEINRLGERWDNKSL